MRTRRLLSRLLHLPRAEWADLVSAQGELLVAWLRVRTRPRGRLVGTAHPAAPPPRHAPDDSARERARELATAVTRAARFGMFRPQCLVRAVALKRMLDGRGILGSRVQIGVRTSGGQFAAHAWVEYGDEVLGDRIGHVETFARMPDVALLEPR